MKKLISLTVLILLLFISNVFAFTESQATKFIGKKVVIQLNEYLVFEKITAIVKFVRDGDVYFYDLKSASNYRIPIYIIENIKEI